MISFSTGSVLHPKNEKRKNQEISVRTEESMLKKV
jgi:hypothetical protein